jgi:hypothetical protein
MTTQTWWGEHHFDLDQTRRWHLAGLDLQLKRSAQEWHIESYRHPQQNEDEHSWSIEEVLRTSLNLCVETLYF